LPKVATDLVVFVLFQSCAENTYRKLKISKKEAEGLARDGVKELILIAQDLTYYGWNWRTKTHKDTDNFLVTV
jgi:tRNA A37 methylthiotransferase MiaB